MTHMPMTEQSVNGTNGDSGERRHYWEERSRVVLTPISAPSVLGLFGFATATLMEGAYLAGWYGNPRTAFYLAPFAITFGGLAQLLAGMWSYRARDTLATAMHGTWGAFWLGWGFLELLGASGAVAIPSNSATYFPALGFWFIMLTIITFFGMIASIPKNLGMFGTFGFLAAGSALAAAGFLSGSVDLRYAAGWSFVVSVGFALYTAGALLLAESFGRTVLPTTALRRSANVPLQQDHRPIQFEEGMSGVRVGQ